jgi:molybdenum cofactor cytidylyltransferase
LAHSVKLTNGRLRKGAVLTKDDVQVLQAEGVSEVVVARLESGDLAENAAAQRLAHSLSEAVGCKLTEAFTGRVNVLADGPGIARIDAEKINRFNLVHPMITVATVPDLHQVDAETMLATIKIISFAVPEAAVTEAAEILRGAIRVAPPMLKSAQLIVSEIDGVDGMKGVEAIRARLARLNVKLTDVVRVPHRQDAIADAIDASTADLKLILTGSATSDLYDVAPEALRQAGGQVERFGMPVDPGNLLFLGTHGVTPVIGLPGCARSPALNGADWVLARVICGVPVTADDIAGMGVGGLLKEIPTRPQPRRRT